MTTTPEQRLKRAAYMRGYRARHGTPQDKMAQHRRIAAQALTRLKHNHLEEYGAIVEQLEAQR